MTVLDNPLDYSAVPGRMFSSDQLDHLHCGLCGAWSGQVTNDGLFVTCGWSSEHDTSTFVWAVRGQARPAPHACVSLCDACIGRLLADGSL